MIWCWYLKLNIHDKSRCVWPITCWPATRRRMVCSPVAPVCQHPPVLRSLGSATYAINQWLPRRSLILKQAHRMWIQRLILSTTDNRLFSNGSRSKTHSSLRICCWDHAAAPVPYGWLPCIGVTRTPTIVVYHPPTIVAVAYRIIKLITCPNHCSSGRCCNHVFFIVNFPYTTIKLISSPNHCSSGRCCNRHFLPSTSPVLWSS